jgi:hypothetical protein
VANTNIEATELSANTSVFNISSDTINAVSNTADINIVTLTFTTDTLEITSANGTVINSNVNVFGDFTANGDVSGTDATFSGNTSLGQTSITTLSISGTDALKLPVGITSERPTGIKGHSRFNDEIGKFEFFDGDDWIQFREESNTVIVETISANSVNADIITSDSYIETHQVVTSSTNSTVIDLRNGNSFSHILTENTTFSFTNPPISGLVHGFSLELVQDSAGSGYTVGWPNVKWQKKTSPTLTSTANGIDIFVFYTRDGGTSWYGFVSGQNQGIVT